MGPGADFPEALVDGLCARLAGRPPTAMARVTVYLNNALMQRRVMEVFARRGPGFLPRLRLIGQIGAEAWPGDLPPATPPLRRQLELMRIVDAYVRASPGVAPQSAVFDLAAALAALAEELQGEGVALGTLAALDVSDHAAHWSRTLAFLRIAAQFIDAGGAIGAEARQRMAVAALAARWRSAPPDGPVIVAGSTGSRTSTLHLMEAVAALPEGAIVLPGFDFDMPAEAWQALDDALGAEDHPQTRHHRLLARLGLPPGAVAAWSVAVMPPDPTRNRMMSLALRPAPVTDVWVREIPAIGPLEQALAGIALIEAPSPRAEALAIAARMRAALAEGRRAALVTPDRNLARQVTAALDRWRIIPDDSAGRPLQQSAPGRLLRQVAELRAAGRADIAALLALGKHPLVHAGEGRGAHLGHLRDLELHLRRKGPAWPDGAALRHWAAGLEPAAASWAGWFGGLVDRACAQDRERGGARPLVNHVAAHRAVSEAFCAGSAPMPAEAAGAALWEGPAGAAARAVMDDLAAEAPHGAEMTADAYRDLVAGLLGGVSVRETVAAHPDVAIIGTREVRARSADIVILGGLNEGVWPGSVAADPWLSRQMRLAAGLVLPERRIGLAAHDFQQAAGAREVLFSRAIRDAEAPTIPSRWLNRLLNMIGAFREHEGSPAVREMRARGERWLAAGIELDDPARLRPGGEVLSAGPRAVRPSPAPPRAERPTRLSVTDISKLIRDPYALYAREILRLRPLDPIQPEADARLRGTVVHRVLERYAKASRPQDESADAAVRRIVDIAAEVLAADVPWPSARALWQARVENFAPGLVAFERQSAGRPVVLEQRGELLIAPLSVTLTARPDRIDLMDDGSVHIIDYKTGTPPSARQQAAFDKQLVLEALMVVAGAFDPPGPRRVAAASYLGLGTKPKIEAADVSPEAIEAARQGLERLIARYMSPAQGYTPRRATFTERETSDYDQLSRLGEWDTADAPVTIPVGRRDDGGGRDDAAGVP